METSVVQTVLGAMEGFSVGALTDVFTGVVGIALPLVLAWFTFRWAWSKLKGAFKKGV